MTYTIELVIFDDNPNAARKHVEDAFEELAAVRVSGESRWGVMLPSGEYSVLVKEYSDVRRMLELFREMADRPSDGTIRIVLLDNYLEDASPCLPGDYGLTLLESLSGESGYFRFAYLGLFTHYADSASVMRALKAGARALIKKEEKFHLVNFLVAALEHAKYFKFELSLTTALEQIDQRLRTRSPLMCSCLATAARFATNAKIPVLLIGETGTGKELLARAIHDLSSRSASPYIAVHCGAISPGLAESELFGHEKGAFTGANQIKKGIFERADGGTVFLDELHQLPKDIQVKLLRVIEGHGFCRVGGTSEIKSDFRIIAATRPKIRDMVKTGQFHDDLLARLNYGVVKLPRLAERPEDVPMLVDHFLEDYFRGTSLSIRFSNEAIEHLASQEWPTNIRELQAVVVRTVMSFSSNASNQVEVEDLKFDDFAREIVPTSLTLTPEDVVALLEVAPRESTARSLLSGLLRHYGQYVPDVTLEVCVQPQFEVSLVQSPSQLLMTKISHMKKRIKDAGFTIERSKGKPIAGYRLVKTASDGFTHE